MGASLLPPDRGDAVHQLLQVLDGGAKRLGNEALPTGLFDEIPGGAARLASQVLETLSNAALAWVRVSR